MARPAMRSVLLGSLPRKRHPPSAAITCCPGSVSGAIGIAETATLVLSQSEGSLHILCKVIENLCRGAGRTDKVDRAVDPPGPRRVPLMSASVLIEAVEAEGFVGGSVVASAQRVQVRPHGMEASKVTTAPSRFRDPSSSVKSLVSLCLAPTSRWSSRCPPCPVTPSRWTWVPSARRAPREFLPSTATALNRPRASAFACWAACRSRQPHAGRRGLRAALAAVRAAGQGPAPGPAGQGGPQSSGSSSHPVPDTGRRSDLTARSRVRSAWPACLPDPLPSRGEPVVPGRGERARSPSGRPAG
jgi:hypothetical protein